MEIILIGDDDPEPAKPRNTDWDLCAAIIVATAVLFVIVASCFNKPKN